MGIQLSVKHEDMLTAGCTASTVTRHYPGDEDMGERAMTFTHMVYDIPGLGEWESYSATSFFGDFNAWGNNRPIREPWLEANNVPYTAC